MKDKKGVKRYFFLVGSLICVVAVMIMIFVFSAQNGNRSNRTSGRVTRFILNIVVKDFDDMSAEEQKVLITGTVHIIRKIAHFVEYSMLGFFLLLHFKSIGYFIGNYIRLDFLFSFAVGVLYAVGDEIHQSFTDGRAATVKDVLLDSSGVAAGTAVAIVLFLLIMLLNKKKGDKYAVY